MILENDTIAVIICNLEQLELRRTNPKRLADMLGLRVIPPNLDAHMKRVYSLKELRIRNNPQEWLYHTYFLLIQKNSASLVGTLGLQGPPDHERHVEIGYFMDPDYMGQGLMTQALSLVTAYLLKEKEISGIYAFTKVDNYASHAVLKKCDYCVKHMEKDMILWERTL